MAGPEKSGPIAASTSGSSRPQGEWKSPSSAITSMNTPPYKTARVDSQTKLPSTTSPGETGVVATAS